MIMEIKRQKLELKFDYFYQKKKKSQVISQTGLVSELAAPLE